MQLSITLTIIVITAITSFISFSSPKVERDLIFHPTDVTYRNQWYRFITCGFIHANVPHLAFNMVSFYFFGQSTRNIIGLEDAFIQLFGNTGRGLYALLYLSALFVCLLPTYFKQKTNDKYYSLGASGAVSAIVFTSIFVSPGLEVGMYFIPARIPGFVFGPLYLIITAVMVKRGGTNINHSAHFWGAVYGILFFSVACFAFTRFNPFANFASEVAKYFNQQ
jgi:membrane associated rhomboid family serine protease